jgi:pimeloyl-ACP methyl ester carboxylesterase
MGFLHRTGAPVRLLHGGLDREAPPDTILELARRTGWHLDGVPGAGHGLPIEQPERCAEAIRGLVAPGQPGAPGG